MAQHHQYYFSLVLFHIQSATTDQNQTEAFSRTLVNRIRSTDQAGWIDNDQLGVILPDTPVSGAACLAEDVQDLTGNNVDTLNYTVYMFPSNPLVHSDTTTIPYDGIIPQVDTTRPDSSEVDADSQFRACELPTSDGARQKSSQRQHAMPTWKRLMDLLGSSLGLLVLSPLFLFVGLFIKAVSKGPVFFKQERVGYQGKIFRLWKFRTYEVDADTSQHQQYMNSLISSSRQDDAPMTKLDKAPGIIPFGNVIRKSCIDELPQLINVFLGEMSLIGPRPPVLYEAEQYTDWHKKRLDAVPGMTGLWQVSGKNRLSFNEMIKLDIQYARMKSFGLDAMILLKTPLAIFSQIADILLAGKSSEA
ncbi:MAG: sugar transferase [Sedimentisphaerales bacterium]|nr:sugar transferase [Sedimentisphaerales bacterium]